MTSWQVNCIDIVGECFIFIAETNLITCLFTKCIAFQSSFTLMLKRLNYQICNIKANSLNRQFLFFYQFNKLLVNESGYMEMVILVKYISLSKEPQSHQLVFLLLVICLIKEEKKKEVRKLFFYYLFREIVKILLTPRKKKSQQCFLQEII